MKKWVSVGRLIATSFLIFGLYADPGKNLPNFDQMPLNVPADMRTMGDEVYHGIRVLAVKPQTISYDRYGNYYEINRDRVFRILTREGIFTDTGLTYEQSAALEDAREYKADFLDYVLRKDYVRYYGKILNVDVGSVTIDQEGTNEKISLTDVQRYRISGKETVIVEQPLPPRWLRRIAVHQTDEWHIFEGTIGFASPFNLYPQVTLGLQTNTTWPIYAGVRAGASGPFITSGWYYAQVQAYLGLNLFRWDYWEGALLLGYIYRAHESNETMSCRCEPGSVGYYSGEESTKILQRNFLAGVAFKFRNVYLEIGWEFRHFFSVVTTLPEVKLPPVSESDAATRAAKIEQGEKFGNFVTNYSRLYFAIGYQFALF